MDQSDKDYLNLLGETMALQAIVSQLARHIAATDAGSVIDAFDDAANIVEQASFKWGGQGKAEHLGHALRVVEELRVAALGSR